MKLYKKETNLLKELEEFSSNIENAQRTSVNINLKLKFFVFINLSHSLSYFKFKKSLSS